MNCERAIEIVNRLIDDRIDMYGYENTVVYLLDMGVTEEELLDYFEFDNDDMFADAVAKYREDAE